MNLTLSRGFFCGTGSASQVADLTARYGFVYASYEQGMDNILMLFAERWLRSVKEECLSQLIVFCEAPLRKTLTQFQKHYHTERNQKGRDNVVYSLVPSSRVASTERRGAPGSFEVLTT